MSEQEHPTLPEPVVQEAMRELTSWVYRTAKLQLNHLRGHRMDLTDPSSRSAAIHTFKHLKHHGHDFDPVELRAWASGNGWAFEDAQALGDYAAGVLAGAHYHTVPDPFGNQAIERWRAAATTNT
ncbi:MAG: hypothetical protein ACLQPH_19380 [Acidimicrobiales bacterium]